MVAPGIEPMISSKVALVAQAVSEAVAQALGNVDSDSSCF